MQACDRCHSRKTRCDRRIPQCSACEKAGVPCLHADKLRQRNIPRGYIDNMENLVAQLRAENQNLRRNLSEAQAEAQRAHEEEEKAGSHPGLPREAFASPGRVTTITAVSSSSEDESSALRATSVAARAQSADTPTSTSSGNGSTRATDPFTLEVGYLTLTATGEARYLGPSSGIDLASIISTVVSAQSGFGIASMMGGGDSGAAGQAGAGHTSSRLPHAVPSDVTSLFPTLAHAMPYIDSYFQNTHLTFPLIHRPSFMAVAERIFKDPGFYLANTLDALTFDMVVSLGSSNKNRFDDSATSIANKCFAMAQAKIKAVVQMGGMAALKAILMICHHGIFSSMCDTSASIWHLLGIGARLCIELGLHLKQRRATDANSPHGNNIVTFEEEMRRRMFWCLYNVDRVVSFTLGRPVAIRDEETSTPLPSPLDDTCFGPDRPIIVEPEDTAGRSDQSKPKKTSPFLHVLKIRQISGQILGLFYNAQNMQDVPMEEKRRARRDFEARLQAWHQGTEHLGFSDASNMPFGSSFTSNEWYTAIYNNAMLLLYRPSPYMPHPARAADSADDMPDLLKLFHAAKTSILSYSELHQKRRLNYSWIAMHGIFIAGLAFIYSVGRILQDPGLRDKVPDLLTVVDVTRACSNILAAICERWNVSRRSCELFNKLSNAVIQDTLQATIRRDSATVSSALLHAQPAAASSSGGDYRALPAAHAETPQQHLPSTQSPFRPYDPVIGGGIGTAMQPLDDMLVMDEFRQFSETLDTTSTQDQMAYPSEMVFGFLQDWPFDLPYSPTAGTMDNDIGGPIDGGMDSTIVEQIDSTMQGIGTQW
ncbi:hypothetical protein SBRCBS47491_009045 [Sporothrix bragantina]|uniref:Zn(2)-C6 fungal-type domain-containing protein n=1 Tax=Sporothrix bragantina TaxID=671064 RepID=A0ABP0CT04_9PEZI